MHGHFLAPLPAVRVAAWARAFAKQNAEAVRALHAEICAFEPPTAQPTPRRRLSPRQRRSLTPKRCNVQHFKAQDPISWFLTCCEVFVMEVRDQGSEDPGPPWREQLHTDGGASLVHLGLTLHGKRNLRLWNGTALSGF